MIPTNSYKVTLLATTPVEALPDEIYVGHKDKVHRILIKVKGRKVRCFRCLKRGHMKSKCKALMSADEAEKSAEAAI